jgi:hypothetical protein
MNPLQGVDLGVIEGYYGPMWSWPARTATMQALAPHGYGFFIFAPKGDAYLRKRWREPHPEADFEALKAFGAACRAAGVRFGVGLSPFEIYRDFGAEAKAALAGKLASLEAMGVEILAILFDDMRGDLPNLAHEQCLILHWIAERSSAKQIILCPTYYSDDPILDRLFGARDPNYLAYLGAHLDPAIDLFWTGEEVCAREFSVRHLARVAETLRRKPVLWDNYPVNDGPIMGQHLHLRAFTGRPAAAAAHIRGHAINPANQATLSRIPALTLADSYRLGTDYNYGEAYARACVAVLGEDLGGRVRRNLGALDDTGLDRIGEHNLANLRAKYAAYDHEGAREIVAFLDGAYRVTYESLEAS